MKEKDEDKKNKRGSLIERPEENTDPRYEQNPTGFERKKSMVDEVNENTARLATIERIAKDFPDIARSLKRQLQLKAVGSARDDKMKDVSGELEKEEQRKKMREAKERMNMLAKN